MRLKPYRRKDSVSEHLKRFYHYLRTTNLRWEYVVAFAACVIAGCSRAPQVPFENLRYSAALLTAANSRNLSHVDQIVVAINKDVAHGAVQDSERRAYDSIILMMRAGQWDQAEAACRKFRKDQLH